MHEEHGAEGFECWVECWPSYDLRSDELSKNFGIGNMRIVFFLKGPAGAIQWMLGTDWGIRAVREHMDKFGWSQWDDPRKPKGWDLGYHAFEPQWEGQESMTEHCEALDGKRCYYDGSGLAAKELVEGFLAGGTKWLWPKLAECYRATFEGGKWPSFEPEYMRRSEDDRMENSRLRDESA